MDLPTTTDNNGIPQEEEVALTGEPQEDFAFQQPTMKNPAHLLRGSGSYPSMIRTRTANRNKIAKRTSDSVIITGHHHHGSGSSSGGGGGGGGSGMMMTGALISDGNMRSSRSKKKKLLNNKKSVYSKASRRKSLENLGLLVRNRCGTAKLQWPSEKKETDVFDLLPEGCIQVRQLIRLKSRGSGVYSLDGSGDHHHPHQYGFSQNSGGLAGGEQRREEEHPVDNYDDHDLDANEENNGTRKRTLTNEAKLKLQGRQKGEQSGCGNTKTDWKNRRNISVIVRIRPKQHNELVEKSIVFRTDSKTIVFDPKEKTKDFYFQGVKQLTRNDFGRKRPNRNASFQYDKVYGPEATNKEIFEEMLKDLTDHLLEGYNSTVFAYGATGSGKTYTMIGSNSNPGLTVLMVESLYKKIEGMAEDYDCEVVCSYLEVYNETIKDLLRPEKELSIREDGKKGIIISELSFYKPRGPQELLKLLRSGNRARTQHATDLNAESSRSHAVFEVKLSLKRKRNRRCQQKGKYHQEHGGNIEDQNGENDEGHGCGESDEDDGRQQRDGINKVEVIQSKLVMVDLAGSERGTAATSSSGLFSDGARQREGASINKSLLALASCISALADGKCHVPYRNSKLTRLLKDSLNGLCTTVMIANISPSVLTSEDTYNTLKYADRAKSIVGPVHKQKNIFMEDLIVEDCTKSQMAELQVKNVQLQEQLEEEKLKRELVLKELEGLQKKNVEMKSEAARDKRNAVGKWMKGKETRRKRVLAGKDTVDYGVLEGSEVGDDDDADEECCFAGKNGALTEDQLPSEIQQYIEIVKERARIFAEYVEFASENRLSEWATSCKKLKADMADFLGRLPVEDENYIWFSRLKNEVNSSKERTFRSNSALSIGGEENDHQQHQHKKYAVKLKNLTKKLELARQNGVESHSLPPAVVATTTSTSPAGNEEMLQREQKMVAITMEEFLEFKRLVAEQEGNEKVSRFYQQFCQHINNNLMTSGMTLMNALKMVKSVYLQLRQVEESINASTSVGTEKRIILSPALQQEYRELLDLVYGPGPPPLEEDKRVATADYNNNNNNISGNGGSSSSVNKNNNLLEPLSVLSPQVPPQLSNLGRKSSPIMDDLASMRKLVELPLLVQLTTVLQQEQGEEEERDSEQDLDLRGKYELGGGLLRKSNSSFSCVVASNNTNTAANTANNRKSLSTSRTIYESPQAPPVTRAMRGGESSAELPLPSRDRRRATCVVEEGEQGEDYEEDADTRYNDGNDDDEDVHDNDRHYLHPHLVDGDNGDEDDDDDGCYQGESLMAETPNAAGESRDHPLWNSCPSTTLTTANNNKISGCNLVNPVKRKNSTSFEIIFDKKERKRDGKSIAGLSRRIQEKSSTPFGPSVMSALSKQKVSETHFKEGESQNEEWTTTTASSSSAAATSSASTSAENVMMMMKVDNGMAPGLVSDLQKKSIGSTKRLGDQALIKDHHRHHRHHHRQQDLKERQTKEVVEVDVEENDNKICAQEDGGEEGGNPSSYIYQLHSLPSPSLPCVSALSDNKSGRLEKRNEDRASSRESRHSRTTKKAASCFFNAAIPSTLASKSNKTEVKNEFHASSTTASVGNNKLDKSTIGHHHHQPHSQNPNPPRRPSHLKKQHGEEEEEDAEKGEHKTDIGSSWRNSNNSRVAARQQLHKQQQQQSCSGGNKNAGGDGGKSLNPLLSVPAGAGVITCTTPPEFAMSIQGQRKNQVGQHQQRLLQYKVIPVKKSIALHPSKAVTDLTASSGLEKVVDGKQNITFRQQQQPQTRYSGQEKQQQKQKNEPRRQEITVMVGSGEEESEWEVRSRGSSMINMPNTNQKGKQDHGNTSQHSLLSSARSTMSHQKAPYFTNSKTFTISRESLPTANMPVISSRTGATVRDDMGKVRCSRVLSPGGRSRHERYVGRKEDDANYYSSNEEGDGYDENHEQYTSQEENGDDDVASSCYSENCN